MSTSPLVLCVYIWPTGHVVRSHAKNCPCQPSVGEAKGMLSGVEQAPLGFKEGLAYGCISFKRRGLFVVLSVQHPIWMSQKRRKNPERFISEFLPLSPRTSADLFQPPCYPERLKDREPFGHGLNTRNAL